MIRLIIECLMFIFFSLFMMDGSIVLDDVVFSIISSLVCRKWISLKMLKLVMCRMVLSMMNMNSVMVI